MKIENIFLKFISVALVIGLCVCVDSALCVDTVQVR